MPTKSRLALRLMHRGILQPSQMGKDFPLCIPTPDMYDAHFVWSVGSAWQRATMALTDRCWSLPVCLPATCHSPSFGQFQIDGSADARTRASMSSLVACIIGYMGMICWGLTASEHAIQRPGSRNCSEL
ncbi:hypothetical protein BDV30DRAFT_210803 [Aspergillus minisclerotigenes]|uniref:Uncharacterized protein n=1 Tax=Aspergillus minisclerotigenes TaxID=656917 RepID=A0A5N6J5F3_9EURO|nr:hypothetical protein BDV30DRAFT_210803 [Aspergillus minisclerotigenes]